MEYSEQHQKHILGIDTSNYKTSVALINESDIICDLRKLLDVKDGEKGLRQSEALFQHVKNLPLLVEGLCEQYKDEIEAVAYSSKPRPVEGSYMPCFLAGESLAKSIAALFEVPAISFSHQEGHIEAIRAFTEMSYDDTFVACHFSGGTCEVLKVSPAECEISPRDFMDSLEEGYHVIHGENTIYDIELIGGSDDISFGQVLDRAGVELGYSFPCGEKLDEIATETTRSSDILTAIKVHDCRFNLSGIDTQIKNRIGDAISAELIREIFEKISDAIVRLLIQVYEKTGVSDIIMSGGVSTSRFIRQAVSDALEERGIIVYFDDLDLSSDNAVGIALLGGKYIWEQDL